MNNSENEQAFCPNCGREVTKAELCPACGSPLSPARDLSFDNKQTINPLPDDPQPDMIPRRRDTYLDGTPIENPAEITEEDVVPSEPAGEPQPLLPRKGIKPVEKSLRLYAVHDLKEKGFFRRIWVLIFDAETFFYYADLNREITGAIVFVALIYGVNLAVLFPISMVNGPLREILQPAYIAIAFAFVLAFIFLVSIFGMILMGAFHKEYASWRKIFGIYAYSTLPFGLSWLGISMFRGSLMSMFISMLFLFPLLMLYMKLCGKGFENAFGIGIFSSPVYAYGIPVSTILFLLLIRWIVLLIG
jgi:hypothetical protein